MSAAPVLPVSRSRWPRSPAPDSPIAAFRSTPMPSRERDPGQPEPAGATATKDQRDIVNRS